MTVLLVLFLIGAAFIALFFKGGRKLWGLALLAITGFVGVVIVGALVVFVLVALIAG